ncbi:MAG: DUF1837 domain-containing protein [Deltaproteobacteria bacterium]|nr:DUF1837 domain-containing protein [Deltaproteobacteria bacterium]
MSLLFKKCLRPSTPSTRGVTVYEEQNGTRQLAITEVQRLIGEHFVGDSTILKAGGYKKAAAVIAHSLPTSKRTRSGDLGELLASEYVDSETQFTVPIRKLRWKSDREMPMHGNDIVAFNKKKVPVEVLKVECKSRAKCSKTVVADAARSLDAHEGRPNPSTLAFITKRLYEENQDEDARVFQSMQSGSMAPRSIVHMVFLLSGEDPSAVLAACPKPAVTGIRRASTALVVRDHQGFIAESFDVNGS